MPNLTHPDAPVGGEDTAKSCDWAVDVRPLGFPVQDHVALANNTT